MRLKSRPSAPEAALVEPFICRLSLWREDNATVEELAADLDRLQSDVQFQSNEDRATIALFVARLRDTFGAIGGMTMSERLVYFDLLDRWDQASDVERAALYKKVLASR